jgi:hypothetical protein
MNTPIEPNSTKVHRSSSPQHRKQVLWQIAVPIGVTILIIFAIATMSVIASGKDFETGLHWANISTILLISPVIGISLIFFIVLALCIYGLSRLLIVIPDFFFKILTYFDLVKTYARIASDYLTNPIVAASALNKQSQTLIKRIVHPFK